MCAHQPTVRAHAPGSVCWKLAPETSACRCRFRSGLKHPVRVDAQVTLVSVVWQYFEVYNQVPSKRGPRALLVSDNGVYGNSLTKQGTRLALPPANGRRKRTTTKACGGTVDDVRCDACQ